MAWEKRVWASKLFAKKSRQDLTFKFIWANKSNLGDQAQNNVINGEKGIQISH